MLASTILYIFVFFIILVIIIEYINEKRYQIKKHEKRQKRTPKKPTETITEEKISPEKSESHVEEISKVQPEPVVEIKIEKEPEAQTKVEVKPDILEVVEEAKVLPECKYPPFTHVRLVEMGLSDEEAREFINELIPQLEEQIHLIENAMNSADFDQIERLTHGIKGSATNLGTGGISDLLVEFNTYIKSGTDPDIIEAYHSHFIHYIDELKKQYA